MSIRRIPFRLSDSRVESQSTVTNYMQMTALGERDVRNIIVGAETERLGKIIAVAVKAIIISRRCYFSCSSGGFCSADVCECPPLHLLPLSPSLSEFPAVFLERERLRSCEESSMLILLTVRAHGTDSSTCSAVKQSTESVPFCSCHANYIHYRWGAPKIKNINLFFSFRSDSFMRLSSNQTLYLLNYIGLNVLFLAQTGRLCKLRFFAQFFFLLVLNIFPPFI